MKNRRRIKTDSGFSLLELVVVVLILSITAAIAVPNLRGWLVNHRLQAAARELYSNMQRAKSEALKRNCSIGVTFSTVTFPAQGGGYTIFLDDGSGGGTVGNAKRDGSEQILANVIMPENCTLYGANFLSKKSTGYNSRGLPLKSRDGSAFLRNDNSVYYKMSLSKSGYPKIRKSLDGTHWK